MDTNRDITLFNRSYNRQTRLDEWNAILIPNVAWHGEQAVTVAADGLHAADTYIVRIPLDSVPAGLVFIDPLGYSVLLDSDKPNYWTIQIGDLVAEGDFRHLTSEADIRKVGFVVTSWQDNRRGSKPMHHWRIEGV